MARGRHPPPANISRRPILPPERSLPPSRKVQPRTSTPPCRLRARRFRNGKRLRRTARARYLYALARQVQKHSRRLAVLETLDNGKPIRESRDIDIPLVARHFYYHAGWAQLLEQEFPGYAPCGVVGQIIPWNFPLLMAGVEDCTGARRRKHCGAEARGIHAAHCARVSRNFARKLDLPAGVVNIVTGDGTTGEALVAHPDVNKIAFTGSTEVGRAIRSATARLTRSLSLELGGKSPFVVFDDADLDSAVEGLVDGIWFNQGQVCCAGSRLLMQESIAETPDRKAQGAHEHAARRTAARQSNRYRRDRRARAARSHPAHGGAGRRRGRVVLAAASRLARARPLFSADAAHQCASILDRRAAGNFRPCACGDDLPHSGEAVELANNTVYGLAASVWSENINVALQWPRN